MSKRFYVIYTLKEFMIPRVFKTKATLLKYLDENKSLQFKQFNNLAEAYNFSRQIQRQVETKFNIKVEKYLENSLKDHRTPSKNQNTAQSEVVHQYTPNNKISEIFKKEEKINNLEVQQSNQRIQVSNETKIVDSKIKSKNEQLTNNVKLTNNYNISKDEKKKQAMPQVIMKKNLENELKQPPKKSQIHKIDRIKQKQQRVTQQQPQSMKIKKQQIDKKFVNKNENQAKKNKQKLQDQFKSNFQKIEAQMKDKRSKQFSWQQSASQLKKEKFKNSQIFREQSGSINKQQKSINSPKVKKFQKITVNTLQNLSERSVRQLNRIDKKLNKGSKQKQFVNSFEDHKYQTKIDGPLKTQEKLSQNYQQQKQSINDTNFKSKLNDKMQKVQQGIVFDKKQQNQIKLNKQNSESIQTKIKQKIKEQVRVSLKKVQQQLKNDTISQKIHELKNHSFQDIGRVHQTILNEQNVSQTTINQKVEQYTNSQHQAFKQTKEPIKQSQRSETQARQDYFVLSPSQNQSDLLKYSSIPNQQIKVKQKQPIHHQHVIDFKSIKLEKKNSFSQRKTPQQLIKQKTKNSLVEKQILKQKKQCLKETKREELNQTITQIQQKSIEHKESQQINIQQIVKIKEKQQLVQSHKFTQTIQQIFTPVQINSDKTPKNQIILENKQIHQSEHLIIDGQSLSNTYNDPSSNSQFLNIHSLFIQTKLLDLSNVDISQKLHLKKSKGGILRINLSQNQNPGYAFASYQLDIDDKTIRKLVLLGVKSKAVAEALSITKGLQLTSNFNISSVKIQSSFPFHNLSKYENSIDKVVRKVMEASKFHQTKINRIDYL